MPHGTFEVTEPEPGAAYGVGTEAPYDVCIWDAVHSAWVNNGPLQGAKGNTGDTGTTFTPSVDAGGNISWTNDGDRANPATRNIKGPAGATGAAGRDGKSPYEVAVENGYTGTEATFNLALTTAASHHERHLPDGADPITVKEGNLDADAVTSGKIKCGAVSNVYSGTISTSWTGTASSDAAYLSPDGSATDFTIDAAPASVTQVKVLATSAILIAGTDYTYGSGTLSFTSAPAAGTNSIEVTYPVTVAPYTQTVTVDALLDADRVLVDADLNGKTLSEAESILDAFASIYRIAVGAGELTVYAGEETSTAIPITVLAVSK